MELINLYNEVVTGFKKNNIEIHTRLNVIKDYVFTKNNNNYGNSARVLDQNVKLLMLLECVLWERVHLSSEFPEKTYDFITLVKNYYAYDIELVAIVKFLVSTKSFTHYTFLDNHLVEEFYEELKFTCTRHLLELRTQVNYVAAKNSRG